jgi:hypothetical protein
MQRKSGDLGIWRVIGSTIVRIAPGPLEEWRVATEMCPIAG